MELTLPEIPAGVVTLLALFTPLGNALLNGFVRLAGVWKRVVSIIFALAIAALSLAIYFAITGDEIPNIAGLLLLAVIVSQSSYALVTKNAAKAIEDTVAVGSITRRESRDPGDEGHRIIPAENAAGPTLEDVGAWREYPNGDDTADSIEAEEGDAEPVSVGALPNGVSDTHRGDHVAG